MKAEFLTEENLVLVEQLTKAFNSNNGKRHYHKSDNLQKLFVTAFASYGKEVVAEILTTVKEDSIYKVLDPLYLRKWVKENGLPEVAKAEPETVEPSSSAQNMTLGLIEQALASVILEKYVPEVNKKVDEYVKNRYGRIEQQIDFVIPEKGKIENEVTHEEFQTILQFVMADEPVMLVGPAGSGKNVICKQVAQLLELDFYFTNAVTQEYKLTGFIDAMGKFHETEFYKAFTRGGLFMLDEIDASIAEVLIILNAAIANRYFDFPNGRVDAHPDFKVVSAANTFGHGASYQYVGRNQLDGASLNRFAVVEIGYSPAIENAITRNIELINFVREFRRSVEVAGVNHIVSYRELSRLDKMLQMEMPVEKALKTCLVKNLDGDDLRMVISEMNDSKKYVKKLKSLC